MIWPFLIYALVAYVVSYVIVEFGQKYLYDEVTPYAWLKVAAGAAIMAAGLTWLRPSFETMFTNSLPQTIGMAIVWAAVFILIYRFQPVHGAVIALVAVLLVPGIASLTVQSLITPRPDERARSTTPSKPLRRGSGVQIAPVEPAK